MLSATIGRPMLVGGWLGLGILAKLYPVFLLPIFGIYYLVNKQYRALLRMLLGCVGAIVLPLLPLILSEPKELFSFLLYHQMRGLQIESFAAGAILLIHVFGLTEAKLVEAKLVHNYGALHLNSPLTDLALKWLPWLMVLVIGVVLVNCFSRFWEEYKRNGASATESLVAYIVAALLAFITTSKVFSLQYVIRLLPLVPLLRLRAAYLTLAIFALTIVIFPFTYADLLAMHLLPVLLLNLRNILVVVLLLWLLMEYMPNSVSYALAIKSRQTARAINFTAPWFWLGKVGLFLLSLTLHFWGLSRFNTLVFDEVYYAKYGINYLNHIPFFDTHPPLGKYLIAIGIWIDTHNPFSHHDLKNALTGSLISPFSYRWLNALTGSLVPLVVAGIAYQLTHRRSYAFIAGLITTADGLLLVESRYALINIYLVIFGLLGQWLFLLALDSHQRQRRFWLALSGICFGASIAVKWNGLEFLAGIYLIWICAWVVRVLQFPPTVVSNSDNNLSSSDRTQVSDRHKASTNAPLSKLTQLSFSCLFLNFVAIPVLVYCLTWIPHLLLNPTLTFWNLHQQILAYHQHVSSNLQEHPYCSSWYTWVWMTRPMGYFFERVPSSSASASSLGFPLPANDGKEIYYDVHGMGNPILWWLSSAAIVMVLRILVQQVQIWLSSLRKSTKHRLYLAKLNDFWIALYLLVNYAVNWLPWIKVTRCSFLYYYMSASIFAFLTLAWIVDRWLRSYQPWLQGGGITMIFLILLALGFWLPIYLGLPLSPEQFQNRMWLRSWI